MNAQVVHWRECTTPACRKTDQVTVAHALTWLLRQPEFFTSFATCARALRFIKVDIGSLVKVGAIEEHRSADAPARVRVCYNVVRQALVGKIWNGGRQELALFTVTHIQDVPWNLQAVSKHVGIRLRWSENDLQGCAAPHTFVTRENVAIARSKVVALYAPRETSFILPLQRRNIGKFVGRGGKAIIPWLAKFKGIFVTWICEEENFCWLRPSWTLFKAVNWQDRMQRALVSAQAVIKNIQSYVPRRFFSVVLDAEVREKDDWHSRKYRARKRPYEVSATLKRGMNLLHRARRKDMSISRAARLRLDSALRRRPRARFTERITARRTKRRTLLRNRGRSPTKWDDSSSSGSMCMSSDRASSASSRYMPDGREFPRKWVGIWKFIAPRRLLTRRKYSGLQKYLGRKITLMNWCQREDIRFSRFPIRYTQEIKYQGALRPSAVVRSVPDKGCPVSEKGENTSVEECDKEEESHATDRVCPVPEESEAGEESHKKERSLGLGLEAGEKRGDAPKEGRKPKKARAPTSISQELKGAGRVPGTHENAVKQNSDEIILDHDYAFEAKLMRNAQFGALLKEVELSPASISTDWLVAEMEKEWCPRYAEFWNYVMQPAIEEVPVKQGKAAKPWGKTKVEENIRDVGHDKWTVDDFLQHEEARNAGLDLADVIGLRLYTGPGCAVLNTALRLKESEEEEFQVTSFVIERAVIRCAVGCRKADTFRGIIGKMPAKFAEKYAKGEKLSHGDAVTFRTFLSSTRNLTRVYDGSMIFILRGKSVREGLLRSGADVSWISQKPREEETLLPPFAELWYSRPEKRDIEAKLRKDPKWRRHDIYEFNIYHRFDATYGGPLVPGY